jgi:hypothetical protein
LHPRIPGEPNAISTTHENEKQTILTDQQTPLDPPVLQIPAKDASELAAVAHAWSHLSDELSVEWEKAPRRDYQEGIMQVRPNKTVVKGQVLSILPEPGGFGAEVQLRVLRNESPSPDDDFLRREEGSILKLFTSNATHKMQIGEIVRAMARLNAGPTDSRAA